ncbi:hypothetical protein SUDANB106_04265 [Streptomyces sp. enrichment culture]|uniref:hypothetical protein n=1 Tax=Streptomyces sp. enrichment culture TaxID=1795815 RepID=UPI003F578D6A
MFSPRSCAKWRTKKRCRVWDALDGWTPFVIFGWKERRRWRTQRDAPTLLFPGSDKVPAEWISVCMTHCQGRAAYRETYTNTGFQGTSWWTATCCRPYVDSSKISRGC